MNHPVAIAVGHKRSISVIPENNFAIDLDAGKNLVVSTSRAELGPNEYLPEETSSGVFKVRLPFSER